MTRYARNKGYIGLAKQTAKGTGLAPVYFVRWDGASGMTPEQSYQKLREGGLGPYPGIILKENHKPDGNFELFARPDIAGFLFAMLLGQDTVSGASAPYTHTIIPADAANLPWVSIERSVAGQLIDRIIDCRIKEITVSGEAGQPLRLQVTYLGITEENQGAEAIESYEVDDPFMFWQGTYTLDGSDKSAVIPQFSITIANAFDEDDFTSEVFRADIPLITRDITGSFRLKFEDDAQFRKTYFGDATGTSPSRTMATGTLNIDLSYGTAESLRQLTIDLPKIYHTVSRVELATNEESSQEYECEFEGSKASASEFVTVTVKNAKQTSYTA